MVTESSLSPSQRARALAAFARRDDVARLDVDGVTWLTPAIIAASLAFALFMGFVGGFLPAARAARLSIVDALRAA
jgi:hypothetical protein